MNDKPKIIPGEGKVVLLSYGTGNDIDAIIHELLKLSEGIRRPRLCQTRLEPGEVEGKDAYLVTPTVFDTMCREGQFLLWWITTKKDPRPFTMFGVPRHDVIGSASSGNCVIIPAKGPQIARVLFEQHTDVFIRKYLLSIFILPPGVSLSDSPEAPQKPRKYRTKKQRQRFFEEIRFADDHKFVLQHAPPVDIATKIFDILKGKDIAVGAT